MTRVRMFSKSKGDRVFIIFSEKNGLLCKKMKCRKKRWLKIVKIMLIPIVRCKNITLPPTDNS